MNTVIYGMDHGEQYFDPSHEAGYAGAHHLLCLNPRGKKIISRQGARKKANN